MHVVLFYFPGHIWTGKWTEAESIEDPEMRLLVDSLPFVMESGLAEATNEKYERAWKKWSEWVSSKNEIDVIPADPLFVAIYLNHHLQTMKTVGSVRSAMHGIAWAHHMAGFPSPTEDPFVKMTARGCERLLSRPTVKSEPLTSPVIRRLVDEYKNRNQSKNLVKYRFLLIADC